MMYLDGDDEAITPVQELVSFLAPTSLEADQYRMLRHAVERARQDAGWRVFAMTSACAGDGKTITTLNLAGSLAQASDARILIVCADLHRETVSEYLGLDKRQPGLAEAIMNEDFGLADAVRRLDALNISILPTGNVPLSKPYELLASPRFGALLNDARRTYDYVLVDTPPVAPLADCRLLGRWVDGFIIVVAANKTPRKLLVEALRMIDSDKVLGTVFNGDDQPLSAYYGYYSQYHQAPTSPARSSVWWPTSR